MNVIKYFDFKAKKYPKGYRNSADAIAKH